MSLRKKRCRKRAPKFLKLNMEFTPGQIAELQQALEELSHEARWHHRVIILPPGRRT